MSKASAPNNAKPTQKPRRLLAIDTSASPGFAVIEYYEDASKQPSLVYCNAFPTDTSLTDAERYEVVKSATALVCYEYGPFDAVCREHFIKGGSKRGTQLVFGGWAAVDMALKTFGYRITDENEIAVSTVKKSVGISGKAVKTIKDADAAERKTGKRPPSVEEGVRQALNLPDDFVFPNNSGGDSSDACAIGIAYLKREGVM